MAALIDVGIITGIKPVLMFLFIFAIIYAILQGTKVIGDSKVIHALIAAVFGFVMLFSSKIAEVIMIMIPWFVVVGILGVLILIILKSLGVSDSAIQSQAKGNGVVWTVIIIFLIIFVGAMISVFGNNDDSGTDYAQGYTLDADGNIVVNDGSSTSSSSSSGSSDIDYSTYNDDYRDVDGDTLGEDLGKTFSHPKVLGFILIMIVALFAIIFLTGSPAPPSK